MGNVNRLLYEVFIQDSNDAVNMKALSVATGMALRTLYEYAEISTKTVPTKVTRGAWEVSEDVRFKLEWLGPDYDVKTKAKARPEKCAAGEAMDVIAQVSATLEALEKAFADDGPAGPLASEREEAKVLSLLDKVQPELDQLRERIKEDLATHRAGGAGLRVARCED
jgi:hypothetical protein